MNIRVHASNAPEDKLKEALDERLDEADEALNECFAMILPLSKKLNNPAYPNRFQK